MQELYPGITRIDVPLRKSPLKATHAYFIRGDKRHLLVDSGWNSPECRQALFYALEDLGAELDSTDIFITHVHADHSGLSAALKTDRNTVYMGQWDGAYSNSVVGEDYTLYINSQSALFGIPQACIMRGAEYELRRFMNNAVIDFHPAREGDPISVGDFRFEVVDLAGHTPGQIGLLEKEKGLLFCGDHILMDISPNIVIWPDDSDAIRLFADNLLKVRRMELDRVFSAHRSPIADYRQRIDELLDHHEKRLKEQMAIIGEGEMTAFELASHMHWDISGGVFANFPRQQIWFATSEAHAHAEHLRRRGLLTRRTEQGCYHYSRTPGPQKPGDCRLR